MTELFVADGVLDNDNDKLGNDSSDKKAQAQTYRSIPVEQSVVFNTLE